MLAIYATMNDIMLLPGCLYLQLISASVNMGVDGALTFRGGGGGRANPLGNSDLVRHIR
jgi:hypothetical protein